MYNFSKIEEKWNKYWKDNNTFRTDVWDFSKPKYYVLDMFPYPSGVGLHAGHVEGYTATDIVSRMKRMQGYNVLHPMGYDSFGLPAEQYAVKTGNNPNGFTEKNINTFTKQLYMLGFDYDWSKMIKTSDPDFYKWTQWIFKQLYLDGYAKLVDMPVNWCEGLGTVLANDEVIDGKSERGGFPVVRKNMKQWIIETPKFAEKLLENLENLDWPESTKEIQRNWIGKSVGAHVNFKVAGHDGLSFTVFTTRCDTLFGATYCVLAPESDLVKQITTLDQKSAVDEYIKICSTKSDLERTELNKEKTGVFTGSYAINPLNGAKVPIWLSDYVLADYGTGAIMCVPAHDDRDFEFAKKFDLPIIQVIAKDGKEIENMTEAYTEAAGTMINSGDWNGMESSVLKKEAPAMIEKMGFGRKTTNYKLRDWVFSRQRYWGEPIPIVHCDKCGYVPLDESELPLLLPEVDSYMPTDNGESPLAAMTDWVNTTCPCCGGPAKRETDTMPQWAGSSWYFLRYTDPTNTEALASPEALKYWLPVDWYNGGMEHTTLHLLYSRFWHKFLYDEGVVPTPEPYQKRTSHGMILGENGEKMSKSRGNVINPDDIVKEYGADTLRTYEMFIGAFDLSASWSDDGVKGCRRFLDRVWKLQTMLDKDNDGYSKDLETKMHQTIKKVSSDFENLKYNTAIAAMMALINDFYKKNSITLGEYKTLITLLNPVAPHITEEIWEIIGGEGRLYEQSWPEYEEAKTVESTVEIAVQINGKTKVTLSIGKDDAKDDVLARAKEALGDRLDGKNIIKEIYVPGRIVNIVAK